MFLVQFTFRLSRERVNTLTSRNPLPVVELAGMILTIGQHATNLVSVRLIGAEGIRPVQVASAAEKLCQLLHDYGSFPACALSGTSIRLELPPTAILPNPNPRLAPLG